MLDCRSGSVEIRILERLDLGGAETVFGQTAASKAWCLL
jgi:hypothetical protein